MTVITLYNINRSPSFFVSDVNIYKNDGNQTKLYSLISVIFINTTSFIKIGGDQTIQYIKNDGNQTILHSLVSVIFYDYIHHLAIMNKLRLSFIDCAMFAFRL